MTQATQLGVTADVLDGGRFRAPFSGVRVCAALPDSLLLRCRAALLLHPEAAVSHASAALLHRLPLPLTTQEGAEGGPVELRVSAGRRAPRLRGVRGHSGLRPDDVVLMRDGVRVVRADVTWGDLADRLTLDDLVVLGDAVLRRGLASVQYLMRIAAAAGIAVGYGCFGWWFPCSSRAPTRQWRPGCVCCFCERGYRVPSPTATSWRTASGSPGRTSATRSCASPSSTTATTTEPRGSGALTERGDSSWRTLGWVVLEFTADDVLRRPEATVERVRRAIAGRASS